MITRSLNREGQTDMREERIELETLETAESQNGDTSAVMRLSNPFREKKMRLRVYDPQFSNPQFGGAHIYLHDVRVLSTRQVFTTKEYICDRVHLVNQDGEELVISHEGAAEDEKGEGE